MPKQYASGPVTYRPDQEGYEIDAKFGPTQYYLEDERGLRVGGRSAHSRRA